MAIFVLVATAALIWLHFQAKAMVQAEARATFDDIANSLCETPITRGEILDGTFNVRLRALIDKPRPRALLGSRPAVSWKRMGEDVVLVVATGHYVDPHEWPEELLHRRPPYCPEKTGFTSERILPEGSWRGRSLLYWAAFPTTSGS